MYRQLLFGSFVIAVVFWGGSINQKPALFFHTAAELAEFRAQRALFVIDSSIIFPTSVACSGCHGFDNNGYALIDGEGNDVNIHDDWSATMMANSAKDPFWRAKVSHEILLYPAHSLDIQDKCTSCHAPNGHYTALFRGQEHYTLADLVADSIGLDGVTCTTCHKISGENLAATFSGEISFDTNRVVYGPYPAPFDPPMQDFVGLTPQFSEHVSDAGMCAPCHTLVTHPFNYEGELIGTSFVEQATYHEWLNSTYGTQNITCQECHMPRLKEPIVIAAGYLFLGGRSPFALHELVGANTAMLKLMKNNRQALDINAQAAQFDETIEKTFQMLQQKSLNLNLTLESLDNDSVTFALKLTNKAGHKFPSGYPSRRAFVSFVLLSEQGDTLFQSGILQPDLEVAGNDPQFEPHHNVINDPGQAQIYEMVTGDVNGQFTTVLERAYASLKDNRLPPAGFRTTHPSYDSMMIVGHALNDPDFNKNAVGAQGSGADVVHYRVGITGYQGNVSAHATVYYQSMPPRWMAEMFSATTPEIETFRTMFNESDQSPVAVGSALLEGVFVDGTVSTEQPDRGFSVKIASNPATDGVSVVQLRGATLQYVKVYSANGQFIRRQNGSNPAVALPRKGLYLLEIGTSKGVVVRKVVY